MRRGNLLGRWGEGGRRAPEEGVGDEDWGGEEGERLDAYDEG